jgi:Ca-activated chloride channel family protein
MKRALLAVWIGLAVLTASAAQAATVYQLVRDGNQAFRDGRFDDALAAYQQAAQLEPNRPEVQINLGNALLQKNDPPGAIAAYNKALGAADERVRQRALYNRAGAQLAAQDFKGAIDSLRRSLRLDPNDEDAKHNLLYAMKKKQEQEEQQQQQQEQQEQQQDQQQQQEQQESSDNKDESAQDQERQEQQKQEEQEPEPTPSAEQEPQSGDQGEEQQAEQAQTQQEPGEMDPQLAAAILDALQKEEQAELKRRLQQVPANADVDQDW